MRSAEVRAEDIKEPISAPCTNCKTMSPFVLHTVGRTWFHCPNPECNLMFNFGNINREGG